MHADQFISHVGTVIVHADQFISHVQNESDVEGPMWLVTNSKELSFDERFAVNLAKRSIGIGLGALGVVRQDVGDNTLVPSFGGVIYCGVRGSAKAFEDGAGSSPCRDMFGPSAGFQQLSLSGWYSNLSDTVYSLPVSYIL